MHTARDSRLQQGLVKILSEVLDGPPGDEAYLLNPGDPGLVTLLEGVDATTASTPPQPGRMTVAAHVDHVHYGLTLLNRWIGGEPNPWATADWNASWQRGNVTEDQWRTLRDALRADADAWRTALAQISEWNEISAPGAIASAAHMAYHLGAIRQILATIKS